MNLTQLRSLISVAETGSFTAAATRVGVTQSGMSQALAALEESLGVKLLTRQRHGVELTAFGERALDHARAAFAHLEAIRKEAAEATGKEAGSLRIAAFPSVFATVLPPLLRRFRALHPDIELVALETDDREVEAWLEAGSIDLGIVLNPSPDSDAVPIGQDAWVAVLPVAHRLARRGTLSFADLAAEPFVLATGGCHVHARTLAEAAGLSLADVRMEVRDWTCSAQNRMAARARSNVSSRWGRTRLTVPGHRACLMDLNWSLPWTTLKLPCLPTSTPWLPCSPKPPSALGRRRTRLPPDTATLRSEPYFRSSVPCLIPRRSWPQLSPFTVSPRSAKCAAWR